MHKNTQGKIGFHSVAGVTQELHVVVRVALSRVYAIHGEIFPSSAKAALRLQWNAMLVIWTALASIHLALA